MTLPTRCAGAAAVAAIAGVLALPSGAGALAGKRSFAQTFPVASALCAEVGRGSGPRRLRRSAARVLSDCATLQSSFNTARATVLAAQASIAAASAPLRAELAKPCAPSARHHEACEKAHRKYRRALAGLGRQRVRAAHVYYAAVEAARLTFWSAVRALPGAGHVREDAPIHEQDS
jgi:hypothetical protein